MNSPVYNPPMPYVGLLPNGSLQPGMTIRINLTISPNPVSFALNLQVGPRVNPRDDIALHLSPVFTPPTRVVRNHLKSQCWGAEESHGGFPFAPGQQYEFIILVEYNCYKIAINGRHFAEFNHRIPFNMVSHLTMDGDVFINSILFEGTTSSYQPSNTPIYPSISGSGIPPYPTGSMNTPYPTPGGMNPPPYPGPPPGNYTPGMANPGYPYPGQPGPYPGQPGPYPTQSGSYPTQPGPYPGQPGPYPTHPGLYPATPGVYPMQPGNYPGPSKYSKPGKSGGIFGSSGPGLAGMAAGVGAAALGASLLSSAVPKLKMKKMFKGPKFFKHPKFFKSPKFFKHKGWGKKKFF